MKQEILSRNTTDKTPIVHNETREAKPTRIESMAKILGCTIDQINTQLAKNARQLRAMHAQAVATGKKINGFTASDLDALAESYEKRVVSEIP